MQRKVKLLLTKRKMEDRLECDNRLTKQEKCTKM